MINLTLLFTMDINRRNHYNNIIAVVKLTEIPPGLEPLVKLDKMMVKQELELVESKILQQFFYMNLTTTYFFVLSIH